MFYQFYLSFQGCLRYLDSGIADLLANATNGIAIVLEHRYYGTYTVLVLTMGYLI